MTMRYLLLLAILLTFRISSWSQIPCADFVFNRWYVDATISSPRYCIPTQDGNFVVVGHYFIGEFNDEQVYRCLIKKMNHDGDILWQNMVAEDSTLEDAFGVAELPDGSFVVVGDTEKHDGVDSGESGYVAKFASNGTLAWEKVFEKPSLWEEFSSVAAYENGDVIVVGTQVNLTAPFVDAWIMRLDGDGQTLWEKTMEGSLFDMALDVIVIPDSQDAWVSVRSNSPDGEFGTASFFSDAWLFQINETGAVVNKKTIGGPNEDYLVHLINTPDGGFAGTGLAGNRVWGAKFDADGNQEWSHHYAGLATVEQGDYICPIGAEGYYVIGNQTYADIDFCQNKGNLDWFIIKMDSDGNLIWSKNYGGSELDYCVGIISVPEGFIAVGETASQDGDAHGIPSMLGQSPMWIIRLENLRYDTLDLGPRDTSVCVGTSFYLRADSSLCAEQILWNTGGTGMEIRADSQGVYWAEAVYGVCTSRDSIKVHFTPCKGESCILFPNAFTPNGDGLNDRFGPIVQCGESEGHEVWIYDRWGQIVYHNTIAGNAGWDGTVENGKLALPDLYVWRSVWQNVIQGQKQTELMYGEVTLLR